MTKEDKELLIRDLCARIPYGVIVRNVRNNFDISDFNHNAEEIKVLINEYNIKPYLRQKLSMTDKEAKDFAMLQTDFYSDGWLYPIAAVNMVDWLNVHHFDYRGLIDKGLALQVPEGMYNIK